VVFFPALLSNPYFWREVFSFPTNIFIPPRLFHKTGQAPPAVPKRDCPPGFWLHLVLKWLNFLGAFNSGTMSKTIACPFFGSKPPPISDDFPPGRNGRTFFFVGPILLLSFRDLLFGRGIFFLVVGVLFCFLCCFERTFSFRMLGWIFKVENPIVLVQ